MLGLGTFRPVVTVDMTTTLMRPATNTTIVAEATVLRPGRTMGFCRQELADGHDGAQLVRNGVGSYSLPSA